MRKRILICTALSVFLIVSIVGALTCSYDLSAEFPDGNIYTSTLPLDPISTLSAFWGPMYGGELAFLTINSFTTTIPLPSYGFTSTLIPGGYTSTLPDDWSENGIVWNIPFGGDSLTLTIRPSLNNTVPVPIPSPLLLILTGSIVLSGLRLKRKFFKS